MTGLPAVEGNGEWPKTLDDLVAYIREGNQQAVENAVTSRNSSDPGNAVEASRWSGKSHAYMDVLAFIENELGVSL